MRVQVHQKREEKKKRIEDKKRQQRNKQNSIISDYKTWLMSERTHMYIHKEETHTTALKKDTGPTFNTAEHNTTK